MYYVRIILLLFMLISFPFAKSGSQYEIKQDLLNYLNSIRNKGTMCSLPIKAFKWNNNLERSSDVHAIDMALNRYLAHHGSGTSYDIVGASLGKPSSFIDRIKYFGFTFEQGIIIGEVLSKVSTKYSKRNDVIPNYKIAVQRWISDSKHCKILMNNRFSDIGISYYIQNGTYYFVMNLGEIK